MEKLKLNSHAAYDIQTEWFKNWWKDDNDVVDSVTMLTTYMKVLPGPEIYLLATEQQLSVRQGTRQTYSLLFKDIYDSELWLVV